MYRERQSFFSKWLVVILLAILIIPVYRGVQRYLAGDPVFFLTGFWIAIGVGVFFAIVRLYTTIDNEGIAITFLPFAWKKRWKWSDIGKVYVKKYSLMDYGGWGYRIGRNGIAYTTKGNYGIQLEMKWGQKILIGTQNPKEVMAIIQHYKPERTDENMD